jgi:hypothetical protein
LLAGKPTLSAPCFRITALATVCEILVKPDASGQNHTDESGDQT